jgi:hypothetical protein
MKKMTQNKDIRLSGTLADRWVTLQNRFGYKTNIHLIEDMMYFFETNPVNPKQNFGGLLKKLEDKMIEFNSDNNRVIAIVRNIEKIKIDTIYRALMTDITSDLRFIKRKFLLNEVKINDQTVSEVQQQNTSNDSLEKLKEDYEKKLKSERERYKLLQVEYDKITLEHGTFYNRLKKLASLFSVEKSTFGKNKIVFEMSEDEFKELIKLR